MSSQPSLDLVILRTCFPDRTRAYYESLLQTSFEHHTDHGPEHYGAALGSIQLEIYPTKSVIPVHDGVGFKVNSIKAAIERVGEQYVHRPASPSPFGLVAMLRDPDGRLVHLTQSSPE